VSDILADWTKFCDGIADFDKSHFLTLFHDIDDISTIEEIISVSSFDLIRDNIIYYFNHQKFDSRELILEEKVIQLALKIHDDLQNISQIIDKSYFSKKIESVIICSSYTEFHEFLIKNGRGYIYDEIISPFILMNCLPQDKITYAMYEALYGIENDYALANSIIHPVFNKNLDLSEYLMLRSCGWDYAVKENMLSIVHQKL
jgi:hypothetical protein